MQTIKIGSRDECVVDASAFQFVPAHECREEREAGGVAGSPAVGARAVAFEVEDGGLFCFPARVGFEEGIEFAEQTGGGTDDDGVAVAAEFLEVALDAIERGGAIVIAASEEAGLWLHYGQWIGLFHWWWRSKK